MNYIDNIPLAILPEPERQRRLAHAARAALGSAGSPELQALRGIAPVAVEERAGWARLAWQVPRPAGGSHLYLLLLRMDGARWRALAPLRVVLSGGTIRGSVPDASLPPMVRLPPADQPPVTVAPADDELRRRIDGVFDVPGLHVRDVADRGLALLLMIDRIAASAAAAIERAAPPSGRTYRDLEVEPTVVALSTFLQPPLIAALASRLATAGEGSDLTRLARIAVGAFKQARQRDAKSLIDEYRRRRTRLGSEEGQPSERNVCAVLVEPLRAVDRLPLWVPPPAMSIVGFVGGFVAEECYAPADRASTERLIGREFLLALRIAMVPYS